MINFESFTLPNGLEVIVHEDHQTPIAVVNIIYNVGSRDEHEDKTGFAHLFEHLMFGGSINIPIFDEPLQKVGGENNAFTSPDITNYYLSLPADNIETAFWLESDRMLSLSFDPQVLEVQRKVVIEEFKQRYLNQPYGDVWLKLRPLAYQVHPYKWATIGKEISHIENATMEDVKSFFNKYYVPNNAILVVAGDVTLKQVKVLAEKWFGPIPSGVKYLRSLTKEPKQLAPRTLETSADVPLNAIYKAYHIDDRLSPDYWATDLLSDILGRGQSSRLYHQLVKEKKILNSVNCYVSSSFEPGLLVIEGKLNTGINMQEANEHINSVLEEVKSSLIEESELIKVKNQALSTLLFGEIELLNRAMNLAFAANLGNANLVNMDEAGIEAVNVKQLQKIANDILVDTNCSTLFYHAKA